MRQRCLTAEDTSGACRKEKSSHVSECPAGRNSYLTPVLSADLLGPPASSSPCCRPAVKMICSLNLPNPSDVFKVIRWPCHPQPLQWGDVFSPAVTIWALVKGIRRQVPRPSAPKTNKMKTKAFDKAPLQEFHRCIASKHLSGIFKNSSCGDCCCAVTVFFVLGFPFLLWEQSKAKSRYFIRRRRDSVSISRKKKKKRCTHSPPSRPPSDLFQRGRLVSCRYGDALDCDTYRGGSREGHCHLLRVWCGWTMCFFLSQCTSRRLGGQQKGASWRP